MCKEIEDAIKTLKSESCYECTYGCESPFSCTCEPCELKKAVALAIKYLEMQIEKKPFTEIEKEEEGFFEEGKEPRGYWGAGEFYYSFICPHCDNEIEFEPAGLEKIRKRERERCKYCGGALNWGKQNDGN